jgi:hypothetical protein
MEVSREELATRFSEMSDEELLGHLRRGDLTPLAQEVATSTLQSRGLVAPTLPGPEDAGAQSHDGLVAGEIDLVAVAEAANAVEANVIRDFLEAHGLFASVWREHAPVSPLAFLPGTLPRVQVRSDQVDQAKALLAAMKRGDLELSEIDLEATQEIVPSPAPTPRRGVDAASASSSAVSTAAVNPVAPAGKGVLSKVLILVIGVLLTLWLWTMLK